VVEFGVGDPPSGAARITHTQADRILTQLQSAPSSCYGIVEFFFPATYTSILIPTAPWATGKDSDRIDLQPVGIRFGSRTSSVDLLLDRAGGDSLYVRIALPVALSKGRTFQDFWESTTQLASVITAQSEEPNDAI
jgi:hypothetical protein